MSIDKLKDCIEYGDGILYCYDAQRNNVVVYREEVVPKNKVPCGVVWELMRKFASAKEI